MAAEHASGEGHARFYFGLAPNLLRLLGRTNHLKLCRLEFVLTQWLAANCSHLHNRALEMAPHQVYGAGPARLYFGLAPTFGPDQSHDIRLLGLGVGAMVGC